MKTLHYSIIIILTSSLVMSCNNVFADNVTTSYGGLVGFRQADFKSNHGDYLIWYKITNGTVISTPLDLSSKTLIFMIKAPYDGQLIVQLPRSTIDSKNQSNDVPYFVAVRGTSGGLSKVNATEMSDDYIRTLKIHFTKYASEIEIVGTFFAENQQPVIKTPSKLLSPLQQFKSGIKPEYVKCNHDLHLIIKVEDGSFACVTIETGKNLAIRGWATTFGTGISTNDYYTKCDTLYPQSDTGIAVFYMPTNSIGKVCVRYHNLNNTPTGIGMRIFEANNIAQNASNVTSWTDNSTLEGDANKTIVYFIKTGTKVGFYGASLNCGGFPLAVGYDANSTITASDFPWIGQTFHCGVITYDSHIEGTTGIGVKYIPYP